MGALTSKAYSFQYRSWELSKKTAIDLTTPFGYRVVVQKRGNEIVRILPHVNFAHNEELITNQSRFSFDAEKQNRLKIKIKKVFIKDKNKLNTIYKPITTKKLLNTITSLNMPSSELHTLIGKYVDFETIMAFKEFTNIMPTSKRSVLSSTEQIGTNYDFRSNYLTQIDLNAFESCDALFLIGCNPTMEEPIIGVHIKRAFHEKGLPIYTLGNIATTAFNSINLGNDINRLINICLGKDKFCRNFLNIRKPLILIGNHFFERKDANAIMMLLKTLYEKLSLIRFLPSNTKNNYLTDLVAKDNYLKLLSYNFWNGMCYLHKNVGTINTLELSANYTTTTKLDKLNFIKPVPLRINKILYLVGADEIKVNEQIYNFIVYQGTHGGLGAFQADLILPTVTPLSYSALYTNMFGQYHFTKSILEKFSYVKSGVFYPLYLNLFFAKVNKLNTYTIYQKEIFSNFRFKSFRYMLLNRILGISNNKFHLVSPFQYIHYLTASNNIVANKVMFNNLITLIKSELENSIKIEFLLQKTSIQKISYDNVLIQFRHNFSVYNLKKKKEAYGIFSLNLNNGMNTKKMVLNKKAFNNSTINFFLQDNVARSSLFMTLGWLRFTAGKNNYTK